MSARKRGYDSTWDKARAGFLAKHQRCECDAHRGRSDAPPADTVDHVIAHKGDKALFWNRANWRAVAHGCNSAKAAREEGGFGNRRPATGGASQNLSGPPLPDRAMPTTHTAAGFSDGGSHPAPVAPSRTWFV